MISFKKVFIPARIGDMKCRTEAEVVNADISLLLSKSSLKKAGSILDLNQDKATMFRKSVELQFTSSYNYCIN